MIASATSDLLGLDPNLLSLPAFEGTLVETATLTARFAISTPSTCYQTGSISGVAIVVATPSCGITSGLPRQLHTFLVGTRKRTDICQSIFRLITFLQKLPSRRPRHPRRGKRDLLPPAIPPLLIGEAIPAIQSGPAPPSSTRKRAVRPSWSP